MNEAVLAMVFLAIVIVLFLAFFGIAAEHRQRRD